MVEMGDTTISSIIAEKVWNSVTMGEPGNLSKAAANRPTLKGLDYQGKHERVQGETGKGGQY